MTITESVCESIDALLKARVKDPEHKALVVAAVMQEFDKVRKKPVADLAARIARMENGVRKMVENMAVEFRDGHLTVKVTGPSELLMAEFRRGTSWFEPWDKVDQIVMTAALSDLRP